METIRILIVDDHLVVRQGLKSLLSQYPDLDVVGEEEHGHGVQQLVEKLKPHVILLDIKLGEGENGLDIARQLCRVSPELKIIILTSYSDEDFLSQAAQVGVHGYLLKSASAEVLAEAIRAIHGGERRLSSDLAGQVFTQLARTKREYEKSRYGLSEEEIVLLKLIADGVTGQEIAQTLYLSERSIKRKTQEIMEKLGAVNRTQAVAEAFRRGIL